MAPPPPRRRRSPPPRWGSPERIPWPRRPPPRYSPVSPPYRRPPPPRDLWSPPPRRPYPLPPRDRYRRSPPPPRRRSPPPLPPRYPPRPLTPPYQRPKYPPPPLSLPYNSPPPPHLHPHPSSSSYRPPPPRYPPYSHSPALKRRPRSLSPPPRARIPSSNLGARTPSSSSSSHPPPPPDSSTSSATSHSLVASPAIPGISSPKYSPPPPILDLQLPPDPSPPPAPVNLHPSRPSPEPPPRQVHSPSSRPIHSPSPPLPEARPPPSPSSSAETDSLPDLSKYSALHDNAPSPPLASPSPRHVPSPAPLVPAKEEEPEQIPFPTTEIKHSMTSKDDVQPSDSTKRPPRLSPSKPRKRPNDLVLDEEDLYQTTAVTRSRSLRTVGPRFDATLRSILDNYNTSSETTENLVASIKVHSCELARQSHRHQRDLLPPTLLYSHTFDSQDNDSNFKVNGDHQDKFLHDRDGINNLLLDQFKYSGLKRTERIDTLKKVYLELHLKWKNHCRRMEKLRQKNHPAASTPRTPSIDPNSGMPFDFPTEPPLQTSSLYGSYGASATSSSRPNRRSGGAIMGYGGDAVRSEAEFLEILASLEDADNRDPNTRAMRTTALVPDMILDPAERDNHLLDFDDSNRLVQDPYLFYGIKSQGLPNKDSSWSEAEVELYHKQFAKFPKQFGKIAAAFENKTASECVKFYYRNKKSFDFRSLYERKKGQGSRARKGLGKTGSSSLLSNLQTVKAPKDLPPHIRLQPLDVSLDTLASASSPSPPPSASPAHKPSQNKRPRPNNNSNSLKRAARFASPPETTATESPGGPPSDSLLAAAEALGALSGSRFESSEAPDDDDDTESNRTADAVATLAKLEAHKPYPTNQLVPPPPPSLSMPIRTSSTLSTKNHNSSSSRRKGSSRSGSKSLVPPGSSDQSTISAQDGNDGSPSSSSALQLQQQSNSNSNSTAGGSNQNRRKSTTSSYWTVAERNDFVRLVKIYGRNFTKLSQGLGYGMKTAVQCRNFFISHQAKLGLLDAALEAEKKVAENGSSVSEDEEIKPENNEDNSNTTPASRTGPTPGFFTDSSASRGNGAPAFPADHQHLNNIEMARVDSGGPLEQVHFATSDSIRGGLDQQSRQTTPVPALAPFITTGNERKSPKRKLMAGRDVMKISNLVVDDHENDGSHSSMEIDHSGWFNDSNGVAAVADGVAAKVEASNVVSSNLNDSQSSTTEDDEPIMPSKADKTVSEVNGESISQSIQLQEKSDLQKNADDNAMSDAMDVENEDKSSSNDVDNLDNDRNIRFGN